MKARVLVIEEDESVQKSLCKALRSEGCAVSAATVSELREEVLVNAADVVVMDADTPARDGWATAARVAAYLRGTPLVLLTAEPGQLRRALAAGASVLLEKPVAVPALLAAIERLLTEGASGTARAATLGKPTI